MIRPSSSPSQLLALLIMEVPCEFSGEPQVAEVRPGIWKVAWEILGLTQGALAELIQSVLAEAKNSAASGLFHLGRGPLPEQAWEGLVVTQPIRDLVRSQFGWTEMGVFPVGEDLPTLYRLEEPASVGSVIRREACDAFLAFLEDADSPLFFVFGEAALGKSTFVQQAIGLVPGRPIFSTGCLPRGLPKASFLNLGNHESAQDLANAVFETLPQERSLLVIEDLHWADAETRQLIGILAGRSDRDYDLLVTSRESKIPTLWKATSYQLRPMGQGQLRELAERTISGLSFSEEDLRCLAEASGGHPLLAIELLQAWHRAGRQAGMRTLLTEKIPQGSTLQKLTELIAENFPNDAPESVAALAELSGSFSPALAGDLLERLGLPATENFLTRTERGYFTFQHELLRSVFRQKSSADPAVLAEVLEAHDRTGEAAGHWEAAENFSKAGEGHGLAAERALAEGRFSLAREHARRALALASEKGVSLADPASPRWTQAMATHFSGLHAEAYPLLEEALRCEGIDRGGSPGIELIKVLLKRPLRGGSRNVLVTRAHRILSEIDWLSNRLNSCIVNILRAQRLARNLPAGDALRAETQAAASLALASLLPKRSTRKKFAEALEECPASERSRVQLFRLLYRMGQHDWREIENEISHWRGASCDQKLGFVFGFLEIAHASFRGEVDEALSLTRSLVTATENYGEENLCGLAQGTLACLVGQTERAESGLRILEETPRLKEVARHEYDALLATFLFQSGEHEEAREALQEFELTVRQRPMVNYAFLMIFPGLCEAAITLKMEFALKFLGKQVRHFPNHRALYRGMLAISQRSPKRLGKAIREAQEIGMVSDAATLIAHGRHLGLDHPELALAGGRERAIAYFWENYED